MGSDPLSSDAGSGEGGGASGRGGVGPCRLVIREEPTCEMLFPAGDKTEDDYHENIDADVFMEWVEKRLVPAIRAKCGDKRMIIILDNAGYHHGVADDWNSPLEATKDANTYLVRKLGVAAVVVSRKGEEIRYPVPAEGSSFPRAPRGPTVEEIRQAAVKKLKELNLEDLLTRAERFFKEKDLGCLLYTPPYSPNLQPIELFWVAAKNFVANSWSGLSRSMFQITEYLRWGFYGKRLPDGSWEHEPPDCGALVRHSMDEANKCVARDEILTGPIDDLQNVPSKYKVSEVYGLDDAAVDEEMGLFDADLDTDATGA